MAKLHKKQRDKLGEGEFAVPGKRALPIHDETHVKLAWDMVDRTQDLSDAERSEARSRILRKAHELGVDTSDWHKVKSMAISAMSLNLLNDDHPNKMPFSGILTRLDEPSDAAPGGANGRRIVVTSEAAEKALGSLLGMAVDFTPSFDGHDEQKKIGIITSANIVGNAIVIEGFIYASDFADTAKLIKQLKDALGFSFEAQQVLIEDPSADILKITELTFTGAAILQKDEAAYQTTSLAASAAETEVNMTTDELKALLEATVAPIAARLDAIEAKANEKIEANANVRALVEPHAAALDAAATAMECDGIGAHPEHGHANALRKMAGHLRAEAALGKVPHIFYGGDNFVHASKDTEDMNKTEVEAIVAAAVEAAVKPLQDKLAAAETKLADQKAKDRLESPAPARKSFEPMVSAILAKAGIILPEGDDKLTVQSVDAALKNTTLNSTQKIMVKTALERQGVLA